MVINQVIDWIIQNKEWVFSGAGVAIISLIFSRKDARNYIKAMFNYKSNVTQINIEHRDGEKK
jgi:hypothetical protein